MKTTFFTVYITENVIRVIGFPQNQIIVALYGYHVMWIALCGAWLYFADLETYLVEINHYIVH